MIITLDTSSRFFRQTFIATTLLAAFICFGLAAFSWTGPTGTPPANNVDAPVNVSGTSQTKSGALGVNGFHNSGSTQFDGSIGIGASPSSSWKVYAQNTQYGIYSNVSSGGYALYGQQGGNGYGVYGYAPASGGVGMRGDGSSYGGMFYNTGSGSAAYLGYGNYGLYTGNYVRADSGFCIGGSCKSSWPYFGGTWASGYQSWGYGGAAYSAQCPSGYVMTGISGYAGNYVDNIRVHCTYLAL